MLNQSNQSDITVDVEQEKLELQQKRQASLERAAKLSVKDHNQKMDRIIVELKKDLENSQKDINNFRLDAQTMKNNQQKSHDDISKYVFGETSRLGQQMDKINKQLEDDLNFFSAQMDQLSQDKLKLDDTTNILDKRIIQVEESVGFRHVYD